MGNVLPSDKASARRRSTSDPEISYFFAAELPAGSLEWPLPRDMGAAAPATTHRFTGFVTDDLLPPDPGWPAAAQGL